MRALYIFHPTTFLYSIFLVRIQKSSISPVGNLIICLLNLSLPITKKIKLKFKDKRTFFPKIIKDIHSHSISTFICFLRDITARFILGKNGSIFNRISTGFKISAPQRGKIKFECWQKNVTTWHTKTQNLKHSKSISPRYHFGQSGTKKVLVDDRGGGVESGLE